MTGKIRRIDYYPDEYISGVGGVLRADEQGVYWMICSLIMSEGGPVPFDARRLAGLLRLRPADIKRIVEALVERGKLTLNEGKLSQKRAQSELERAANRIQSASENGAKGGRPKQKTEQNQQNQKAGGFQNEKLTTNHQLATSKEEPPNPHGGDGPPPDPDDVREAFDAYNLTAESLGLPKARDLTQERRRRIRSRLAASGGLETWREALANIRASDFLTGKTEAGFRADIDFLCQAKSFQRLIEGYYSAKGPGPPGSSNVTEFDKAAIERRLYGQAS